MTMTFRALLCLALFVATSALAQTRDIGPPPGRLVDVGGRKLHLYCTGGGSPTVVLEAGAGAFAIDWALVQPEIAHTNRVCSYDRAGSGWSDAAHSVQTHEGIVLDLHAALQAAGEKPPYVMVGASMGGIYVRLFELRYRNEVVGMVLVDPSSEDRLFTMFNGEGVPIYSLTAEQLRSGIPPGAATIPRRSAQTGAPFNLLPRDLYELRIKLEEKLIASRPSSVSHDVVATSAEGERGALAELHRATVTEQHPLGNRPLVVLSRGTDSSQELRDVHAALARLSTNSRHTVVAGSGHEIHLYQPGAVLQAIRDVLASVRNGAPLTSR